MEKPEPGRGRGRYIIDVHNNTIHDLDNAKDGCRLDAIGETETYEHPGLVITEGQGNPELCEHCIDAEAFNAEIKDL